jgi:hypothetical protein
MVFLQIGSVNGGNGMPGASAEKSRLISKKGGKSLDQGDLTIGALAEMQIINGTFVMTLTKRCQDRLIVILGLKMIKGGVAGMT